MKTIEAALSAAGSPPPGFKAMPVDIGVSFFGRGRQPPYPTKGDSTVIAPAGIISFSDWRVFFVPDSD